MKQAYVGWGVSRRLDYLPRANIGWDDYPIRERSAGLGERADVLLELIQGGWFGEQFGWDTVFLGDPRTQRTDGIGVDERGRPVLMAWVHPKLASGASKHRRCLPVVICVGMGADEKAYLFELIADLAERALELFERTAGMRPAVDEHDAAVCGERPSVAVRHDPPGQWQP
jgi:hypothetical protein